MDPISVSASIVGLLSVTAHVSSLVVAFIQSGKEAPKSAQDVLSEVTDIRSCLGQLESYLLGTKVAAASRTTMLMVEHIVVTLTTCVATFSELEETLVNLIKDRPHSVIDKIKWARKEEQISKLVLRLQSSKSSLNLMLTMLTCVTVDEARASGMALQKLVHTVLENNHEMSNRLRVIEMQTCGELTNFDGKSSCQGTIDDALTTRSEIAYAAKTQEITQTTSVHIQREVPNFSLPFSSTKFNFAFDQDLKTSRVYKRAAFRHSNFSLPSSAARSIGWSFFSGQSLANISNISVISLPISTEDLWNPKHYMTDMGYLELDGGTVPDAQVKNKAVKIVLLGDLCSGKSTILKQFNILQGNGFAMFDRVYARREIYHSVYDFIEELESPSGFLKKYTASTYKLWREYCELNSLNSTSAVYDNGPYYLNNIERLVEPDYVPTDQDILRLYTRTTGVYESYFNIDNYAYRVTDVGGDRAERKKWSHCLNDVDYLFFIVPLTGYSQTAYGGPATQMNEALDLFESLGSLQQIQNCIYVVIFTKLDIFKDMISDKPITTYFPDFKGGDRVDDALDYFKSRFRSNLVSRSPEKMVYFKYINATDTNTLKGILEKLQQG